MSKIIITQNDQGKTIEAHQGDEIVFRLEENLTTGYGWEVEPIESSKLELIDSNYIPSPPIVMGRGGMRVLRLVARSPGNHEIHLKLRRSWESPDKALSRLDVLIKVR